MKKANSNFIESITKLSQHVFLERLKDDEIIHIINDRFPTFSSHKIGEKLLQVYKALDFLTNSDENDELSSYRKSLIREVRNLTLR